MKFDEALKLQNFAEHYSTILGNISIANKELETILLEKEKIDQIVVELKKIILPLEKEIKFLTSNRDQLVFEIESKTKQINDKDSTSLKLEYEVNELQKQVLKNIDIREAQAKKEIADNFELYRTQESILIKSIETLSKQFNNLSHTSINLSEDIQRFRKEKEQLSTEIQKLSTSHRKSIEEKDKELTSILKQIKESRAKVLDIDNHLIKRENDLTNRENDVLIITRRLQELFKEAKPGIALKI